MGVKHLRVHVALAALCVLALAACGSSGSGSGGSSGSSGASGSTASASSGSFGTLGKVCGPGNAKGATATGVTNTSIEVAVIADINVPGAPGLLQPMWDSATAFTDWCNAAGGIDGRKLILDKRDSAETDYLPQVETSCTADFAMVGTMGVLDNTGVAAWEKCGIPNFTASTVSEAAANAKLMYPSNPLPADQENIGGFPVIFQQNPGVQDAHRNSVRRGGCRAPGSSTPTTRRSPLTAARSSTPPSTTPWARSTGRRTWRP